MVTVTSQSQPSHLLWSGVSPICYLVSSVYYEAELTFFLKCFSVNKNKTLNINRCRYVLVVY